MTNNIVTEVFNFNIYGYYLSTNRGSFVVYIHLRQWCMYCIIVSTLQFAALMFDIFFVYFVIDNLPSRNFFFLYRHKNSYLLFYPRFSLILSIFLVFMLIVILHGVNSWYFYYGKCALAGWFCKFL